MKEERGGFMAPAAFLLMIFADGRCPPPIESRERSLTFHFIPKAGSVGRGGLPSSPSPAHCGRLYQILPLTA